MKELLFEKTINTLHENGKLTFKQLKEMISTCSSFVLENKNIDKKKQVLLSYSCNEGKVIVADNKTDIKEGGKKINEYVKTCEDMKEEVMYSLTNLENNINSMNHADQEEIFGPAASIYYKINILKNPEDALNYNTKDVNIFPEGHGEYNNEGKLLINEVTNQYNKFNSLLTEWQAKNLQEKYSSESNAIGKLKELHNKQYVNLANSKINNCLSSVNSYIKNDRFALNDNSSINDYMLSRIYILLNTILDRSKTGEYGPVAKMNIAKRILGVGGISYQDINKVLEPEQISYIKENILNNQSRNQLLETAIRPIEQVIVEYSSNILKSTQSLLSLNEDASSRRAYKQINNTLKFINMSNGLRTLKNELKNLRHVDRNINNYNKSFIYEGQIYKPNYSYKPINELLKLFKPLNEQVIQTKIVNENNIYDIINETIKKRGNKYCLISKQNKRNLGCYNTKTGAEKREKQVQYFKNVKEETSMSGGSIAIGAVPKEQTES
jgi:hypothetical protein